MLVFLVFLAYVVVLIPVICSSLKALKRVMAAEEVEAAELGPTWPKMKKAVIFSTIGVLLLSLGLLYAHLYTELLWFGNLGYDSVFWKRIATEWSLFGIFGAVTLIIYELNFRLLRRILRPQLASETGRRVFSWLAHICSGLIAVIVGSIAFGKWISFQLYLNQVGTGTTDPIFQKDISFYLFSLPIQNFISTLLLVLFIIIGAIVVTIYVSYIVGLQSNIQRLKNSCITHGSLLGVAIFAMAIWKFVLAKYHLLFGGGVVRGIGYTDLHNRIPMFNVMIGICGVVIVTLLANLFFRKWKVLVATLGTFFVLWLVLAAIVPAIYQTLVVGPQELEREREYLEYNIQYTRDAYGLAEITEEEFSYQPTISLETLNQNQGTLANIRIWDWRALASSYEQRQGLRKYYKFPDIDIDRYMVNGVYRQVMLAGRELDKSLLDPTSQTWVNLRLKYTHGYGVVLNQVNEFGPSGMPNFLVMDIPPQSYVEEIKISRPEIYYGLLTTDHVIVKTTEQEFDYPSGDQNIYSTYQGTGGVEIGSGLRKLAFALRFDGIKLLISEHIKIDSRIMFHRQIEERLRTLAPFLMYDKDPYLVIDSQGMLFYVVDAYATSSSYPYSEPYDSEPYEGLNYIRNSVKVVIDLYNGTTVFYVFDEEDPVIRTYQNIFPALFRSKDEMPEDLMAHVRYPEDLISIQGKVYCTYHMADPQVFYNKEDLWQVAEEIYALGERQEVIPYYVIIRLPGETKEEFIQMIPFTPQAEGRDNLVGWLAGRADGENYGKVLAFKFPKQELVYGPMQFEARVDQNEEMSQAFTLWGQLGSDVIRGNTLAIPIENSIMYVEPVYLKAAQAEMPEIKRVIVAISDRLDWGTSLEDALKKVTGEEEPEEPKEDIEALIQSARGHFAEYLRLTGEGKLMEAAEELNKLWEDLNRLFELTSEE